MMPDELLNNIPCEVFRIFLTELEDPELAKVYEQLRSELASRRACDIDCARLFFSSLTASDLEIARQQILAEQAGRLEDAKMAGLLTVAE